MSWIRDKVVPYPGWHSTWRLAPTLQSQPRATDLRGGHWPGGAGPSCSGPVHSCHSRVPTRSSVSSVTWPDVASLCTRHMSPSGRGAHGLLAGPGAPGPAHPLRAELLLPKLAIYLISGFRVGGNLSDDNSVIRAIWSTCRRGEKLNWIGFEF